MAGGGRHHRAGHRLESGLWFRPGGLPARGGGYRIMYLHVPAIWSMGIYAAMAVAAFTGLWSTGSENGPAAHLPSRRWRRWGRCAQLHRAGHRRGVGQTDVGRTVGVGRALTSGLVLLCFSTGAIALWRTFDDRKWPKTRGGILVLVGVVNLLVIHYSVGGGTPCTEGLDADAAEHRQRCARRYAGPSAGYLLLWRRCRDAGCAT